MTHAGEVARGNLAIVGLGLEVERNPVVTAVDVPSYVQTFFGGKAGSEAPPAPGLSVLGDLTGPGIDAPITLSTIPGQKFAIPALHEKGDYTLMNIRLVGAGGEFLQQGVPSFATITVTDVLQTRVKVRQLTAAELRERGIFIDDRNYEVYEYTFIFGVGENEVEIPYPVIIDKRTREIIPAIPSGFTMLPFPKTQKPPRFSPPQIQPFELDFESGSVGDGPKDQSPRAGSASLPAALVVPNGFGVLHQFFAVVLQVGNSAPEGSNIQLDAISARLHSPLTMRVSKVTPAVALGQPVPIVDEVTGASFLVVGAQGSAEWALEALKAGTHTIDVDVQATYQKPGEDPFKIGGRVSASIVVSDPRFHVNFSHPDVVRKNDKYTAFAFVTNLSSQRQHVFIDLSDIPSCSSGSHANNVCRYEGDDRVELDIEPGEMVTVPHKLTSRVTGHVYAGAGAAADEAVGVSVKLSTGVSESGIPLSPATLVMPYHSRFLPSEFVDANLQLLGLGYSLATAPLTKVTALKPRVITTDVFRRAQQIALAGQRVFTIRRQRDTNDPLENRDPFFHLSLDLLGNTERVDLENLMPELAEYDELRRQEEAGRVSGAAMARQLEANGPSVPRELVDEFAGATSHRTPFLFAYVHGAPVAGNVRPYALSVQGHSSLATMDVPAEAASGWVRNLPYGELTRLNVGGEEGELALVGRWTENVRIKVVPAINTFTLHLLYPDTASGKMLRTDIQIVNALTGVPVTIDLARGDRSLTVLGATPVVTVVDVAQTELRVIGAAQDLHLDDGGHIVGLLFNRPITVAGDARLRDLLALTINVPQANYEVTRRNDTANPNAELQIPGAALQNDGRLVLITFDKTLSTNASYKIAIEQIGDLVNEGASFSANDIVPRIDNNRSGGILTGKVLLADNVTPVPGILVRLWTPNNVTTEAGRKITDLIQYDVALSDGRYLFEFVPRDLDDQLLGNYTLIAETADGKQAKVEGAVRRPGEVHPVNLVFLGSGTLRGQFRWEDGEPIANWKVNAGSPLFGGMGEVTTDANGNFEIGGLPVGPVVASTVDPDGRMVYATASIRTAGEIVTQDLVAVRKEGPPPGVATVRILVLRSDTMQPVAGAQVGVGSPQVPLWSATTDSNGRHEFTDVPAGLMSIIAADFSISRHSAGVEVELRGDQILEQTLVLQVADSSVRYATLQGVVKRDDPTAPGDVTKDQIVPGAILSVYGLPAVIANASGEYVFEDLPLTYTDKWIQVYDPATTRTGWFKIPTLFEGVNEFPIRLKSLDPFGRATMRVRLYGAKGEPVAGERVFIAGYPPINFANKGGGVYELADVSVPQSDEVWAVSDANGPYGDQFVRGSVRVDFGGQIGVTDLRLPGMGKVIASIELDQPCATELCPQPGQVAMSYTVWNDYLQKTDTKTIIGSHDPATNLVTFEKVPARQDITFATHRHPAGYASQVVQLAYDGDARIIRLRMKTTGNVTGRVFAHDGVTPVAGATVRINTGTATYAPGTTKQDGSFEFAAIPANVSFDVVAEMQQDGIFRTGIVHAKTPEGGGPVSDLLIVMREQSEIEGKVVMNAGGAIVPLARYWLRELAWPYRSIGSPLDPMQADINGRFVVGNVFTGPFRVTAVAPDNQEVRGDYQGTLIEEGDVSQRDIEVRIGGGGVGTISVTVVDPLLGFEPVANAEVSLRRGGQVFDFTTTNDAGVAYFEEVPADGSYSAVAFSKQRGRSGQSNSFAVANGLTTSVSIQLDFLGVVSGTLTDPDTDPADLPVRGQPVTYTGQALYLRATTDTDGAWEMQGVPEGSFTLSAWDTTSQRIATGPSGLFISKLVPEQRNIHLQLERMGTLTVKVYLPDDSGGPGELAPLVDVTASQCTICNLNEADYPYFRGAQGNPVVFPRMFRRVGYSLKVRELGGEARTVGVNGQFPANALTHEHIVVLSASGTVEAIVRDGNGNPVAGAEVHISGSRSARIFTGADGKIVLPASPFGWYSAEARKDNVTAAASGELRSRSTPLVLPLNLGTNITVTGHVDAEEGLGLPSIGTRVILNAATSVVGGGLRMETRTDDNGNYTFTGIPISDTTLRLQFVGPDDSTTIEPLAPIAVPNGTTGTFTVPTVKLDATPPRVLSINPPPNSTNVSPSADITVVFSEPIAQQFLNNFYFELLSTDPAAPGVVPAVISGSVRPDNTYIVKIDPTSLLRSNVLYRFAVRDGIEDLKQNKLKVAIGQSFTTVDYTEPAVVRITPPVTEALPQQVTFRIKFNKAVDIRSFDAGNGGVINLETRASDQDPWTPVAIVAPYLDPLDPSTIAFAPQGVAIQPSSFYRVSISGVRDTLEPPNTQVGLAVFNYFSFDTIKPVATIVSPVAAGEKLTAGVLYAATVAVTDEGTGATADDVAYVDWLDAGGVSIARVKTAPYTYEFVAPSTGTSFTLKATATDLSNNSSPQLATFTWEVAPNAAPKNINVANQFAPPLYPSKPVTTRVTFEDEGVAVTVKLELAGTNIDGTPFTQILGSQNITRASTSVAFAEAVFSWSVPLSLKDGTANVIATVTDSANNAGSGQSAIAVALDDTPPQIVSFLPEAENRYKFGVNGSYTIELQVRDLETGVARAVFSVNGANIFDSTGGSYDASTGVTTFTKSVSVPPKNADTRIPIVVTAYDHRGKFITDTHEVIYERVDDASLPRAAWITPLDGAALPSNVAGWETTLRIKATDDVKVTSVRFVSDALASPIELTAPKSGTTDIFEAKAALTFPADGSSFVIRAVVADGDPSHDVELPITIDPVAANPVVNGDINITGLTASQYENKSVLVRGNVRVYISVPITLKDLMLVDGALLSVPEETKLDLTITDRLFVDGDSRVDVSDRGWLGGLRAREDASFTNPSRNGRTIGGVATNGAFESDGSHAGIGGNAFGTTNATYGSITDPAEFGSGGSAQPSSQGDRQGGNGGGAISIRGGSGLARFVLAGPVRANGSNAGGIVWSGGAGGSIDLRVRTLITSPLTRISANGGDAEASDQVDRGGGGGRIAVRVSDRLDVDPAAPLLQARGGRNSGSEGSQFVEGGAGTIYLVRPTSTLGELIVSSHDERNPSTTHRANGTPLAGTLNFDAITVGPRALARFDVDIPTNVTFDASATILGPTDVPTIAIGATTPAANADVLQHTSIATSFTAASTAGIAQVRTMLSVQPKDVVAFPQFATDIPSTPTSIAVPHTAPAGPASLKVRVIDRSGRVADSNAVAFNIVANNAPIIDMFNVSPNGEVYAKSVSVDAAAHDDVAVTSLALSTTIGTVTAQAPQTPTPQQMTRAFAVTIPPTTTPGTQLTLTLTAADGFPDRPSTQQQQSLTIKSDTLPPSLTIVAPVANQQFNEASGAQFAVDVDAADAEVGVQRVTATFEGVDYELSFVSGTRWSRNIPLPNVDGTAPVAKNLVVRAYDYQGNGTTRDVTFTVNPLIDPSAPALSWACSSPDAMYPQGYEITFTVNAIPNVPANGVKNMSLTFDNGAPVAFTRIGTSDVWQAKASIPGGTADGTSLAVRVVALSQADNESTLLGTVTAVSGVVITIPSTIAANDAGFENQNVIVGSGGVLTITGPHTLRNVVVLSGGRLVQQHVDKLSADELKVDRLFVACGGVIDVSSLGMSRLSSYPGAGVPDGASGGSHIGRGSVWWRATGGVFGSVYEPKEPGGGGNASNDSSGGGSVRIRATGAVVIDGSVLANGSGPGNGAGAGGSVWIATQGALSGNGNIEARGAFGSFGAGGGGAIALEYASTSGNYQVDARGGTTAADPSRTAAPGTILRRVIGTNGDLIIDAKTTPLSWSSTTELPAFGAATVDARNGNTVSIRERRWISPSISGHRLRAYAPDGSVRGTYRIASVTKHPSTVTLDGWVVVNTQDSLNYAGYLMYAPNGLGGRKYVAVRKNGALWEYDNDSAFVPFAPTASDVIFASFTKQGGEFRPLNPIRCEAACGSIEGIATAEVLAGQMDPDAVTPNMQDGFWNFDSGEILLRADVYRRALTFAAASPALTLETLSGVDVQPGDRLRGLYRFDNIKLTNARVVTEDLVESVNGVEKNAASTFVSGNFDAPTIDTAKISIGRGLNGPVLIGTAGAITDSDGPIEVASRIGNFARPLPVTLGMEDFAGTGTAGGFSIKHVDNGQTNGGYLWTNTGIAQGYLSFSPSQTNARMRVGLGGYWFRLDNNATYQVFSNNSNTGVSGAYATNTAFRIEKSATSIRFVVDNIAVYETTSNIPASLALDVQMPETSFGEIGSIEFVATGLPARSLHGKVNADGSFRIPITNAVVGDPVRVFARDRHVYSMESGEIELVVPNDIGIASVTSAPVIGGRSTTGTVTLFGPAGNEGVLVKLQSNNAVAGVPATITIAAGAISGTFNVTTTTVAADVDVNITATYAGSSTAGVLRVLKDSLPPVITITAPSPNAEYDEGDIAKILVSATIADQDSAVTRAWAELDGQSYEMTFAAGVWSAEIPVPFITGEVSVTKEIVVRGEDSGANVGSATRSIVIRPIVDPTPPQLAWKCRGDLVLPVGYPAPIAVNASPALFSGIEKVEITITDPNGVATTYPAPSLATHVYGITFPVPDVANESVFTMRAVATTAGGGTSSIVGTLRVLNGATEIRTNTIIGPNTTTYDNTSVIVWEGATLTIEGAHTFQRLIVLGTLTHPTLARVDVNAASIYVSCGAVVNAIGLGYDNAARYSPDLPAVGASLGGNHIGRGGLNPANQTFGSVVRPLEAGGGGYHKRGGGVVAMNAMTVTVDGAIRVDGASATGGGEGAGAGGSIWIRTSRIDGKGTISADGGNGCGPGGGGAISIDYTDASSVIPMVTARAGNGDCSDRIGGPGTVRIAGPEMPLGEVTIDAWGRGEGTIELPALGSGIAQAGSSGTTLVTGRSSDIASFFIGHWVRITAPDGMVKGTWRIATIPTPRTVTLEPNGAELIAIDAGDRWQGIYRFDALLVWDSVKLISVDPIETATQTIAAPLTTSAIRTDNLHLESGAVVKAPDPNPSSTLTIDVTNELRIDANARIDVTGQGYDNNNRYSASIPAAGGSQGGGHIGRGGGTGAGFTFGSVYRPLEGGGGGYNQRGGGVALIKASSLIVNGAIRANGANHVGGGEGVGAGGSIWIRTNRISGNGTISADGGKGCGAGGGGAIAIEYSDATSVMPALSARSGVHDCGNIGGAGSIFKFGPASTFGDMIVDNTGRTAGTTELPALGKGFAQPGTSGATLVTDRASDLPAYFIGHWVAMPNGTWRVGTINGRTVTLVPNGSETISLSPGDAWEGVYRFDALTTYQTTLTSLDRIEYAILNTAQASPSHSYVARGDEAQNITITATSGGARTATLQLLPVGGTQ